MLIHCNFFEPDGSHVYRPELIERAVSAAVWINPTLYAWQTEIDGLEAKRAQVGLSPAEEKDLAELPGVVEMVVEAAGLMFRAGARVVAGSDTPWRWAKPTFGLAREIAMLARAGMSNRQAIIAGTSASAESIGVGEVAGRLAPGRLADLAIFSGNPLTDLSALERPLDVFQAGVRLERVA
jgi:imidazolonepropionase-like amidohydrolase